MFGRMKAQLVFSLIVVLILGLMGCGIRGAPIPPKDPELYYNDYQADVLKKEREDEQKSKFRRRYSPSDTLQK
jgi:hypothetical protein